MARNDKYIFKLTPNRNTVVINTSVLEEGKYTDVSYPIKYVLDSEKFIVDKDTYKFVDSSLGYGRKLNYPTGLDMTGYVEDIRFYAVNKQLGNVGIGFNVNVKVNDDSTGYIIYNDESLNTSTNYNIPFKFEVIPLWNDKQYLIGKDDVFNVDIKIKRRESVTYKDNILESTFEDFDVFYNNGFSNDSKTYIKKYLGVDASTIENLDSSFYDKYNNTSILNFKVSNGDTRTFKNIIRDSFTYNQQEVADIEINVAYTHNDSSIVATAYNVYTVTQAGYPGPEIIYHNVKLCDYTTPLELWSPEINFTYTFNKDINPKIEGEENVIQYINVNGKFKPNPKAYKDVQLNSYILNHDFGNIYDNINDSSDYFSNSKVNILAYENQLICKPYYYNPDTESYEISYTDVSLFTNVINRCKNLATSKNVEGNLAYNIFGVVNPDISDISIIENNDSVDISTTLFCGLYPKYYTENQKYYLVLRLSDGYAYIKDAGNFNYIFYDASTVRIGSTVNIGSSIKPGGSIADIGGSGNLEVTESEGNLNIVRPGGSTATIIKPTTNTTFVSIVPSGEEKLIVLEDTLDNSKYKKVYTNLDYIIDTTLNLSDSSIYQSVPENKLIKINSSIYSGELKEGDNIDDKQRYKLVNPIPDTQYIATRVGLSKVSNKLSSYKIEETVSDNISTLIQYSYCINNPFTCKDFQTPVYGAFPVLSGYVPIYRYEYDFVKKTQSVYINTNITYDITLDSSNNPINILSRDEDTHALKINYDLLEYWINRHIINGVDVNTKDLILEQIGNSKDLVRTTVNTSVGVIGYKGLYRSQEMIYGAADDSTTYNIKIDSSYLASDNILSINGESTLSASTNISPYIFSITMDTSKYTNKPYVADLDIFTDDISIIQGKLVITNDECEKNLHNFKHEGKDINNSLESFMLLRANPKLSGNIKLVVDSEYNLYIDTFKSSDILNNSNYRKYPVSAEGNYPRDVRKVFKSLPISELYKTSKNSLNAHKIYTDYQDQYETMYEYGAETNTDVLYSENMKILAPLHIGKNIPEFFTIFRYDGIYNTETYNNQGFVDIDKFKSLIKDSTVVKTIDLRQYTSIGQYLNNYKNIIQNYGYGQCGLLFIEQDNYINSEQYRQGKNIWKGILVKQGILAEQTETSYFANKILNDSSLQNKQELFNGYIQSGFERHGLLYPNILNLEYMFDDTEYEEYSMHRYFGIYLYENDFIEYGYVSDIKNGNNLILQKYNTSGNLYTDDLKTLREIFTEKYSDRIFYAVTNDNAARVYNETDVNVFLSDYIKNQPESNIVEVAADRLIFGQNQKSFITLHIKNPLQYGEHIKIILMNVPDKNTAYIGAESSNILYNHIVYEFIASNDERLKDTEYNISPYVTTHVCDYNNAVIFKRISFYSQDKLYPSVSATINEQIQRIVQCINKFKDDDTISVSFNDKTSLSIISTHSETYIQHIAAPDLNKFTYDYMHIKELSGGSIHVCTTNKDNSESLRYISGTNITHNITKDDRIFDDEYQIIVSDDNSDITKNSTWYSYVESEDSDNIIEDNISYFNKSLKYEMKAMSPVTEFYDSYYVPFSNYMFETTGWRHNTVVKFIATNNITNSYILYNDISDKLINIYNPLVYTTYNMYESVYKLVIESGYLSNNIINPYMYGAFTDKTQHIIYDSKENNILVTNPFNSSYNILCSNSDILLTNNVIRLYKPKSALIAVMGISNIKDIDVNVETLTEIHRESKLTVSFKENEIVSLTEGDARLQHAVMYKVASGIMLIWPHHISAGNTFVIIPTSNVNYAYVYVILENLQSINDIVQVSVSYASMLTDVVIEIVDKQKYLNYNYSTYLPEIKLNHFFNDINDIQNSDLMYPVVPTVNCAWKSTGLYIDDNNVLDTNNLTKTYKQEVGHFTESVYTPALFEPNQYVINKLNNVLYVDGKITTYKDCILNKTLTHPIKKLLIDNVNINTAVCHYNYNTYSLEFIYFGIKFNIKFNDKIVNTFLHLDRYDNYNVFIINEYDSLKTNELYISDHEEFILMVNHQFYIDYAHEGDNNIKDLFGNKGYAPYSTYAAPINVDFSTLYNNGYVTGYMSYNKGSLLKHIDIHNLWSSWFIECGENNYIYSPLENIMEHGNYISFMNYADSTYIKNNTNKNSIDFAYIMTKADGDYNYESVAGISLKDYATKSDFDLLEMSYNVKKPVTYYGVGKDSKNTYYDKLTPNTSTNTEIPKDFSNLLVNIKNKVEYVKKDFINDEIKTTLDYLQELYNEHVDKTRKFLSVESINELKEYAAKMLYTESIRDKQERYMKSITNNIDIYVIPENSEYKHIQNTDEYNTLIFSVSLPNYIKYNYGYFTPNVNNMVDYAIDDIELGNIIDVDLLRANTNICGISKLVNYTGNKVFEQSNNKVDLNYFTIPERSLLSSTWDNGYYRLYKSEDSYIEYDGQLTGIDDKSFFGSRCMILRNPYIQLDKWSYATANDLYYTSIVDSEFNEGTDNKKCLQIEIKLSNVLYHFFINNKNFTDNWKEFKEAQYTGMKNYINYTMTSYYNMNSHIDLEIYKIDTNLNDSINIIDTDEYNPKYQLYENYKSKINFVNNEYVLTIIINDITGMDIHPVLKIYRK